MQVDVHATCHAAFCVASLSIQLLLMPFLFDSFICSFGAADHAQDSTHVTSFI